tara:strand:+ start:3156 stop:4982 length:1827 start_codon:yes stop_codon:yes gene_type:complete
MTQLFNSFGPTNELGLLDHQVSFDTGTVVGATLQDTIATNPLTQLWRWNELSRARDGDLQPVFATTDIDGQGITLSPRYRYADHSIYGNRQRTREPDVISEEEQLELIAEQKLEGQLEAVEGETQEGLALRIKWKQEEVTRRSILQSSDGDVSTMAAQFGIGLFGSMLDPLNVASGFVPVIGVARYSRMLAQQASTLGRTGVRIGVGSAEGAAGAVMVEPLVLMATDVTGYEYDYYDSFANLAFGTVLGGGLHGLGGLAADAITRAGAKDTDLTALQKSTYANYRIVKAIDTVDEQTRRELMEVGLGQFMSGHQINGVDTALRKSLEENQGVAPGPRPDRDIIRNPAEVRFDDDPALGEGRAITVTASDGEGVQVSFRNIADAEKKAKQLEKKGFSAAVRSLGEDDHRIDLTVENTFVRRPDGEYVTYPDRATAEYAAKLNKDPDTVLHVTKIGDEFLLYETQTNTRTVAGIRNALDASGDEIQMPLEVPVVRSEINPDVEGPTIQEIAQQDVRDANSDNTLFGEMQERELAAEVDRIMENITEAADVPQIEAEIAELEAQIEVMKAEVGDDAQARQDLDDATAGLQKTRESQKAWEQAAVCVLGGLT